MEEEKCFYICDNENVFGLFCIKRTVENGGEDLLCKFPSLRFVFRRLITGIQIIVIIWSF